MVYPLASVRREMRNRERHNDGTEGPSDNCGTPKRPQPIVGLRRDRKRLKSCRRGYARAASGRRPDPIRRPIR